MTSNPGRLIPPLAPSKIFLWGFKTTSKFVFLVWICVINHLSINVSNYTYMHITCWLCFRLCCFYWKKKKK